MTSIEILTKCYLVVFMHIPSRIKALRKALGITQAALAERLRLVPLTITRWESGERTPDFVALVALASMTGASLRWLELGEGEMWGSREDQRLPMEELFLDRPLIVGTATCDPSGRIEDPGPDASRFCLRRDFAAQILSRCGGGKDDDLFFLQCPGESMCPTILDKEIVLLNSAMKIRIEPKDNGIYLVRRSPEDNEARLKRIRLDKLKGQLMLASDNRAFAPSTVELEGTPLHQFILGRVVWVGRYLLELDPPEEEW